MIEIDNLLHEIPCGIFSFSDDGLVQQVNDHFCAMVGYTRDELTQKKVEEIFTIPTRIFFQTHFFPLLKMQGYADEIFLTLKSNAKGQLPVLVNAKRKENNSPVNICACMLVNNRQKYEAEILESKRTAEQALEENTELVQAKKMLQENVEQLDDRLTRLMHRNGQLREFSHIISHDLQEPLRKLSVFSDMLRNDLPANTKASKIVDKLSTIYHRMRGMVLGLQHFVWLEQEEKKIEPVHLDEVMQKAFLEVKEKYKDFEFASEPIPTILGNKEQLEMLFFHLFENANKFRQENVSAEVRITASIIQQNSFHVLADKYKYVDYLKIDCVDNGVGIPEEYGDYVFRLFKKLNPDAEGLGLGLAFCKKIVENHHGSIKISQAERGTRFVLLLPLHPQV